MAETTSTAKLPMTPEEITTEWLASVLKLSIKTSEITGTILDQSAAKVFVTLTYEDGCTGDERPQHICLEGGGFRGHNTTMRPSLIMTQASTQL
jgi:hypothetical protein